MFTLLSEPSDRDYYHLLDYALAECKYVLLVIRDTMRLNLKGQRVIEKLSDYLHEEKQTDEWPGTKLLNNQARVLVYDYVPEVAEILKTPVSSLFRWLQPDFPEDLCLLKKDETPWLVTISHENDGYFVLSEQEKDQLFHALPQYRFMVKSGIESKIR